MARQRLHSAMAEVDLLTREELDESLNSQLSAAVRMRFLGIDSVRFPRIVTQAAGTTTNLFANPGESPCGPSSGDVWMLRHLLVASSVLSDTAKYVIYRGSSPTDATNGYGPLQLLEGFIGGATPGLSVNVGWYPGNKAVLIQPGEQIYAQILTSTAGNTYVLSGEVTRIPAEMKGKIL